MSEPAPPAAAPLPAVLRPLGRLGAAAVLGVAAALLTATLPRDTRIILGLDVFLLTFVALTYVLMSATGRRAIPRAGAKRSAPPRPASRA